MPFPSYQSDLGQHEITDETGQPLLKDSSFLVYNRANLHVLPVFVVLLLTRFNADL